MGDATNREVRNIAPTFRILSGRARLNVKNNIYVFGTRTNTVWRIPEMGIWDGFLFFVILILLQWSHIRKKGAPSLRLEDSIEVANSLKRRIARR